MKGNERSEQDDLDYICSAAFAPVDCALKHPGEHATGERPGSERSDFFGIRSGKRRIAFLLSSEKKRKETCKMILIILLGMFAVAALSDLISLPVPGHVPGQAFAMLVSEMLKSCRRKSQDD